MNNQYNSKFAFLTLKKLAEKSVDDKLIKLKYAHDNKCNAQSQLNVLTLDIKQKQITNELNKSQKSLKTYTTLLDKQDKKQMLQQSRLQQKLTDEFAQQQLTRRILNEY